MTASSPPRIRFERFEVDTRSGELRRGGLRVNLQDQPFQALALLLERPGEVVTREELRKRLWPENTFVDFDRGLNKAIAKLRAALRDDAERPRYIETLPQRGYRFIAPLTEDNGRMGENGHGASVTAAVLAHPDLAAPVPTCAPEIAPSFTPPSGQPAAKQRAVFPHRSVTLAALVLALAASLILSLRSESGLLGRTSWGASVRHLVLGGAVRRSAVTERRLTANPADTPVISSVISPDGKYLAFTDRTGFYLREIEGGQTYPLALPKGFRVNAESWFPDRDRILVTWLADPKSVPSVWSISVLGGAPRWLIEDGFCPRVSPDGSQIIFLRGKVGYEEIWLMRADGTGAHRILGGTETERADFFTPISWNQDARRIAFGRMTKQLRDRSETRVEIADVTSGLSKVLVSRPGLGRAIGWAAKDRLIYSLAEPTPNEIDMNLWSLELEPGSAQPQGPALRLTSAGEIAADLSVTRDGKLMALRRLNPQPDVYIAEIRGDRVMGTPRRLTLDEGQDYPYSWTADSNAVIFVSDRDGRNHIYKQDIHDAQPQLLVGGSEDLLLPRLAPDGETILYLLGPRPEDRSHTVRLMRMPLRGGPPQFVFGAPGIWNYQCARLPSNLCIYSPSEPGQQRFFTFNLNGAKGTEIKAAEFQGGGQINWSLSPDGQHLASVQQTGVTKAGIEGASAIQVLSLHDGSKRSIPVPGWGAICGMDWAADGRSLWVGATKAAVGLGGVDSSNLLKVELGGKVTVLTGKGNVGFCAAIPSPDGRRLALFGATTFPSNVWLLEHF